MPASITALQMAPECGGATGFDGAQHAFLSAGQSGSMRLAKLLAMSADDIGNLKCWAHQS
jgi:hypothetical protein